MSETRARGDDRNALWRGDRNAALGLVIGVGCGAQFTIGLRNGAVKRVIGEGAIDVQRVRGGNDPALPVVTDGGPTAIGIAAALNPAKGVVFDEGGGVQDRCVGDDAGAQTPMFVGA